MMKSVFARILRRLGISKTRTPDRANQKQALLLLKEQGDWAALLEKGHELLLQNPPQYEAIEFVAYNLQQGGQLEAAAVIARQATELFPDCWIFHFLAGVALKETGREKEARNYLQQALVILPHDPQTIRQFMEVIAKLEGIEFAAKKYAEHCKEFGIQAEIVVAPIRAVRDWAQEVGVSLLEAGEVEEIPFKAPHIWGNFPASDTVFALSNQPYVADLTDARIFSSSSLILSSDDVVLSDAASHPKLGRYISFANEKVVRAQQPDKLLLDFSGYKTRTIETGIFLSGCATEYYGHWLPEFLPKLQFLQQHPDFANLPIIVDAGMPQSHFDHLRRLVNNPLILLEANETALCRRLLVAPTPAFSPVLLLPHEIPEHEFPGLSPRAMRFLRGDGLNEDKKLGHRRLFLARKNMKWRRLLNEDEIVADLSTLGFETVFLEEMTASEQIDLFQQAECIVAPNGSAVLNLIFADTTTKMLVLIQPHVFNWGTFQGPMDALGYQTLCVCGDYALSEGQKHSDYHIPVQRIREALTSLGIDAVTV